MGWLTWSLIIIIGAFLVYKWITVYNDFQFLYNKATQKINDVNIILKQRIDNINALAVLVQKYSAHEFNTIKETIGERGEATEEEITKSLINLKAVQEQYPTLKADALFESLMDRDTEIETTLKETRKEFNRIVQKYNTCVCQFPRNIVAKFHKIQKMKYYAFSELKTYDGKDIMGEVK